MKKSNRLWKVLLLVLVFAMLTGEASVLAQAEETTTSTTVQKGWKKIDGKYHYFVKGVELKNTWKTISGKRYYFGADGARKSGGWYTVLSEGKCYYFNSKGVWDQKTYKKIDVTFVKKLDSVIKASKYASGTTTTARLKKLAVYLGNKNRYTYGRAPLGFDPKKVTGWGKKLGYALLTEKQGSCYHHAGAFAYLAKRATGLPTRMCVGQTKALTGKWQTKHAWAEVKINGVWYIYDTNAMAYSTLTGKRWYYLSHDRFENVYYKTEKTWNITI